MKTSTLLFIGCLLVLCISSAWKPEVMKDKTSVKVSEDETLYELSASFNSNKNERVQQAINNEIQPKVIFKAGDSEIDATIKLANRTQFHLKSSDGKLYIKFDKSKNSVASYHQMQRLYKAICNSLE